MSKRLNREDFPSLKFYLQKRRSFTRKQRRWLTDTAGLCSLINLSDLVTQSIFIVSCSLNLKFYPTRKLTDISMRPWWFSQQRSYKQLLINLISQNLRRKSTDCSDQTLLIFHREYNLMRPERRSTPSSKSQDPRRPAQS